MEKLTFITGNAGKAAYMSSYFHLPVDHTKLELPEIQSLRPQEVAEYKAKEAYKRLGTPVLVEDGSLTFKALGRLPGTFIKWFFDELGNEGLIKLLEPYEDRTAIVEVVYALCDETGVHTFTATQEGEITKELRGSNGFGWDPIFMTKGHNKTWAELTDDEKHEVSPRKDALNQIKKFLESKN
jgi:non-canonical purine NTP pyrophosphatase (RdgB/HAM1 family)